MLFKDIQQGKSLKKQKFKTLGVLFLSTFLSAAIATTPPARQPASHRASSLSDPDGVPVGDELSSIPASIARYNASRHEPEAHPSDDYKGYPVGLCHLPGYFCQPVRPSLKWGNLARDTHDREVLMRLNRTNVALKYRRWVVLPKQPSSVDYMTLTPMPATVKPTGHRLVMVDLSRFAFGAYDEHGDLVYWGPASGGKAYCEDTKESCKTAVGHYRVYRIKGEDCTSSTYPLDTKGGAPMPYCMYYHKGFAIHGSSLSGFINRSRGCVRVFYNDAKWLNQDFVTLGTRVIVSR